MTAPDSQTDSIPPEPGASDPAGPEAPAPTDLLSQALAEQNDFRDKLLRAHAELENYRKRVQRERDEERRFSAGPVIRDLLPVLDNLRRAVEAAGQGGRVEDLQQGVAMVLQQAEEWLGKHHVLPIAAAGRPFDPNLHEALTQVPSVDQPPLTVLQEVERGYTLHDRVLRPSKVIVSS